MLLLQFTTLAVLMRQGCSEHWNHHDDTFLHSANRDIANFHNFLSNIQRRLRDQVVAASHKKDVSKGAKHLHDKSGGNTIRGYKKTGGSKEKHVDRGRKFDSDKEDRKKEWGEKKGKHTHYDTGKHHEDQHHHHMQHYLGDVFKDAHKYNKGNYEKGFREKYHLDEQKKHKKFWKNADKHDKWAKFGGHESKHAKEKQGAKKGETHKEGASSSKDGKKGKKEKTVLSSQSQGHKKEKGHEFVYAHEKRLQ